MRVLGMCVLVVLCCVSAGWGIPRPETGSAESATVEIARGVIALHIEEREPVDVTDSVPSGTEQVFCFVEVRGAAEDTHVVLVWYWEDQEMARVELPVRSARWRTWSSKQLQPDWAGAWRVEILDAGGDVLETVRFTVVAS